MSTRVTVVIRLAANPQRPRWRSSRWSSAGGSRVSPSADYAGGCCFVSCTPTLSRLSGKKRRLHPGMKRSGLRVRVHGLSQDISLCNSCTQRPQRPTRIFCLPGSSDGIIPLRRTKNSEWMAPLLAPLSPPSLLHE